MDYENSEALVFLRFSEKTLISFAWWHSTKNDEKQESVKKNYIFETYRKYGKNRYWNINSNIFNDANLICTKIFHDP